MTKGHDQREQAVTTLKTRTATATKDLEDVANGLKKANQSSLSKECTGLFADCSKWAAELASIEGLIDTRELQRQVLKALPGGTDQSTDEVEYLGVKLPFHAARLLGFQAFLATTWAISDTVTAVLGRLACLDEVRANPTTTAKLIRHFIKDGKSARGFGAAILREAYAWPIAVSYVIRNHFAHDGGVRSGNDFFESRSAALAFRVSQAGWSYVDDQVRKEHGAVPRQTRRAMQWPPGDDLLDVLDLCHAELDDALGILMVSSARAVRTDATLLLEGGLL